MGSGDELRIYVSELARALEQNLPPPPIPPDMPFAPRSEIDALIAGLGMAANAGDPADAMNTQAGYEQRELHTGDAMTKFPANEEQSSQALQQVMGMAQQLPQAASGFGGIFSGFFQSLNQAMQQGVQAGQQLAGGLGKSSQAAELAGELPAGGLGGSAAELAGAGSAAGGGALEGTTPAAMLGPPPTPSAATFPASASATPATPSAPDSSSGSRGGMGGMPMMPPGAMGAPGGSGKDDKPDTKRVVGPSIKNGAPVQGRITAPPTAPQVTKRVEGKPVASRRILAPEQQDDDPGSSR